MPGGFVMLNKGSEKMSVMEALLYEEYLRSVEQKHQKKLNIKKKNHRKEEIHFDGIENFIGEEKTKS